MLEDKARRLHSPNAFFSAGITVKSLFDCGLVVGKFAPLHRGHQHVISTALKTCREVVLLTYCDPDIPGYEPALRQRWLDELYPCEHSGAGLAKLSKLIRLQMTLRQWTDARRFALQEHRELIQIVWSVHNAFC